MSQESVIIFGGSSGIGEATAKRLLADGLRVVIVGRDRSRLEAAQSRLGGVETASVDATDRAAVKHAGGRHGAAGRHGHDGRTGYGICSRQDDRA